MATGNWKFVYSLLALAPSSNHLFFWQQGGHRHRRQSHFCRNCTFSHAVHAPVPRTAYSGSNNIHSLLHIRLMVFPNALKLCSVVSFLNFFFFIIFLFNHGPKGRRQWFLHSVTQLVREERMSVSGMLTSTKIWRSSFSTDILSTAPKEV